MRIILTCVATGAGWSSNDTGSSRLFSSATLPSLKLSAESALFGKCLDTPTDTGLDTKIEKDMLLFKCIHILVYYYVYYIIAQIIKSHTPPQYTAQYIVYTLLCRNILTCSY